MLVKYASLGDLVTNLYSSPPIEVNCNTPMQPPTFYWLMKYFHLRIARLLADLIVFGAFNFAGINQLHPCKDNRSG